MTMKATRPHDDRVLDREWRAKVSLPSMSVAPRHVTPRHVTRRGHRPLVGADGSCGQLQARRLVHVLAGDDVGEEIGLAPGE